MPPVGFEPTISAGERRQAYTLDRAATGTGYTVCWLHFLNFLRFFSEYANGKDGVGIVLTVQVNTFDTLIRDIDIV